MTPRNDRSPPPAAPSNAGRIESRSVTLADGAGIRTLTCRPAPGSTDDGLPFGAIVLLHSGVGHAAMFRHQFIPLADRGWTVLAYDRRGFGGTTVPVRTSGSGTANAPAAPAPDAMSDPVADLAELLDLTLPAGPVHLVGAAAGGRTAAEFALAHAARVASLTLASSLAGLTADLYPGGTARLLPPELLALPEYLRELGPTYRGEDPAGVEAWIRLLEKGRKGYQRSAPGPPAVSSVRAQALAALAAGTTGRPGGRSLPIRLITGDSDPYVTPAAYRRLSELLPRSRHQTIPGAGHSPYWENPAAFNRAVLDGLADAPTESSFLQEATS